MALIIIVFFFVLEICSGAQNEKRCSQSVKNSEGLFGSWRELSETEVKASVLSPKAVVLAAVQQQTDIHNEALPASYEDKLGIERVYTQVCSTGSINYSFFTVYDAPQTNCVVAELCTYNEKTCFIDTYINIISLRLYYSYKNS